MNLRIKIVNFSKNKKEKRRRSLGKKERNREKRGIKRRLKNPIIMQIMMKKSLNWNCDHFNKVFMRFSLNPHIILNVGL